MTTPIGRTYVPTFSEQMGQLCEFITKYGDTIVAATTLVSPTDAAAMATLITTLQAGCLLVKKIHLLIDPNFGDTVADS